MSLSPDSTPAMDLQSIEQQQITCSEFLNSNANHQQDKHGALPIAGFTGEASSPWLSLDKRLSPVLTENSISFEKSAQAVVNLLPDLSISMVEHFEGHPSSRNMDDNELTPRPQNAELLNHDTSPEYQMQGTDVQVSLALNCPDLQPQHSHGVSDTAYTAGGSTQTNAADIRFEFYAEPVSTTDVARPLLIESHLSLLAQMPPLATNHQTLENGEFYELRLRSHQNEAADTPRLGTQKLLYQPQGASKLFHNQRILVSVKASNGLDVPLFALVRFDISRSFIEERVVRGLYLEVHPVPLGRLNVEQTHLGFFTPSHFACFQFTLNPYEVVDAVTSMLVIDSTDCLNPIILGRNFLEKALGYKFAGEPGEPQNVRRRMSNIHGNVHLFREEIT